MNESPRLSRLARAFALPAGILAIFFAVFGLARLALLWAHPQEFAELSAGEIARAFARGLRFDASIIFLAAGIPVFLLMLPVPIAWQRAWRRVWGWACFAILLGLALVLATDDAYFGFVGRHVGVEVSAPEESAAAIVFTGAIQYPLPLLAFALCALGAFFAWRRLLRRESPPRTDPALRSALAVAALPLMYVGFVGSLWGMNLRIVHAFQGVRHEGEAFLALNGPFSILHSLDTLAPARIEFYPWEDALRTAQSQVFAPGETPVRADYPMLRARAAAQGPRPNVVLIMLESWAAVAVDAHRRELGLEPLGLTPNYDSLARQGRLLSRFYAAGQRSMDGMSALIAGFPTLPRLPFLGRGIEQSGMSFLGRLARQEGYATLFIQSAHRASFRNDAIASLAGFDTYEGGEDIPPDRDAVSRAILGGEAWDHEMFDEASRKLAQAQRPFLAFLYTATTHTPYAWPGKAWEKFPPDSSQGRYWNSIAYADAALGRLLEAARRDGWFDSTIFIVTADHVGGPSGWSREDPASYHHIPGLIVAPGLAPGVDARIGSQLDVIPTIADLAGWSAPESALGRSLLADGPRGAFCVEGDLLLRVEPDGFVLHDLDRRVRSVARVPGADLDAMEHRLLSFYQVAAKLAGRNRLYPPAALAP